MAGHPPPGGPGERAPFGMSMRFHVKIDDSVDLGSWSSCKGLEVKCKLHKIREHGQYDFERILFADVEYESIKLERAVDAVSTAKLQKWLADALASQPGDQLISTIFGSRTAVITLLDSTWKVAGQWTLRGVYPKSWSGPTMDASKAAVAIERLELAHEGFLPEASIADGLI